MWFWVWSYKRGSTVGKLSKHSGVLLFVLLYLTVTYEWAGNLWPNMLSLRVSNIRIDNVVVVVCFSGSMLFIKMSCIHLQLACHYCYSMLSTRVFWMLWRYNALRVTGTGSVSVSRTTTFHATRQELTESLCCCVVSVSPSRELLHLRWCHNCTYLESGYLVNGVLRRLKCKAGEIMAHVQPEYRQSRGGFNVSTSWHLAYILST